MDACPACGSPRLYPSRARSLGERIRRVFTRKRPYRCHACDWRRWMNVPLPPSHADTGPDDLRSGRKTQSLGKSDFDGLDPR
ncbi:MAG: hypothetical protein ACRD09_15395 [Vicinamibacterales bacterium]